MQELVKEIVFSDLKKYIISSKNCRATLGGFDLISRYSVLSFKFPEFAGNSKCVVVARRKSGNGANLIASGQNVNHQHVTSIKPQEFVIDLDASGIVTIKRTHNAIGCIEVSSIKIFKDNPDASVIAAKWNEVLSKCSKHTCMRLSDNKLFASSAAIVEAGQILSVETNPPNLYKIEGSKVTFLSDCEVVSLHVVASDESANITPPVHIDVTPPPSAVTVDSNKPTQVTYDSRVAGLNALNLSKECTLNGDVVVVGNKGRVNIEGFEIGFVYAVSIEAKKIDGNGKFAVQLSDDVSSRKIFISDDGFNIFVVNIDPVRHDDLSIFRTESGTGNIAIRRILISRQQNVQKQQKTPDIENDPVEIIDYAGFTGSESSKWELEKIPKVIHFYWGGNKLPFLRYVSIYSFVKHNPDWKVKLHVPEVLGKPRPTWRTSEQVETVNTHTKSKNYVHKIEELGIEVIKHNFDKYKVKNTAHEVHKSDFLRWILLSTEGGVWSDNDIIYTRPITYMIDNNSGNKDIDAFVCVYNSQHHAIGFLMSGANNEFYRVVSQFSSKLYNAKEYQSIGAVMFNRKFKAIKNSAKSCVVSHLNPNSVYSITNIKQFLSPKMNINDYNMAIGFHWYGGHPDISKFEAEIDETNYKNFNNFIAKLVKYTLDD